MEIQVISTLCFNETAVYIWVVGIFVLGAAFALLCAAFVGRYVAEGG